MSRERPRKEKRIQPTRRGDGCGTSVSAIKDPVGRPSDKWKILPLWNLEDRYEYCAETGELRFKNHRCKNKVGALAGAPVDYPGRKYLRVAHPDYGHYLVHRICYKLHSGKEPSDVVDHINGNTLDNRACNLRDVSQLANARNRNDHVKSPSKVRGVTWYEPGGYWRARINTEDGLAVGQLHCVAFVKRRDLYLDGRPPSDLYGRANEWALSTDRNHKAA